MESISICDSRFGVIILSPWIEYRWLPSPGEPGAAPPPPRKPLLPGDPLPPPPPPASAAMLPVEYLL